VDEGGHAKLADFGLSVLLIEGNITATTSNGTYRWSAPELFVEGDVHRKPPSDIYSFSCACLEVVVHRCTHKLKPANMLIEAHTRKPPFATISSDHIVAVRIINGERPCWPIAPARGHDVSAGIRELSERCWNSDPARRPTAEAIVESLALEISRDVIVPQVLQPPPIASNVGISALQEASMKPISFSYDAVTRDRVSANTVGGHRVSDSSSISKLSKRLEIDGVK
jgi:serine/threonine protein kinase